MMNKKFLTIKSAQKNMSDEDFLKAYKKLEEVENFIKNNKGKAMNINDEIFAPLELRYYDLRENKYYINSLYFATKTDLEKYFKNQTNKPRKVIIEYNYIKNAKIIINKNIYDFIDLVFDKPEIVHNKESYYKHSETKEIYKADEIEMRNILFNSENVSNIKLKNLNTGKIIEADSDFCRELIPVSSTIAKKHLMNFSQITPDIYIGSEFFSHEIDKLKNLGITAILSLENRVYDIKNKLDQYGIDYEEVFVPDYTVPNSYAMEKAVNYIDSVISSGGKIYIHCIGGTGRSPLVLLTYLVKSGKNVLDALRFISEKRYLYFSPKQIEYIYYLAQSQNPQLYKSDKEKYYLETQLQKILRENEN